MKITQEEVTHVANLSKLKFSPEETAEFATTLKDWQRGLPLLA